MSGPESRHHPSRRRFLQTSVAAAAGVSLALPSRSAHARPGEATQATNLIFMVADGMSQGTLALGDLLSRRLDGKRCHWVELMRHDRVVRSLIDTRSADSFVTDSAASSSAWSTGTLMNNGSICVAPDGTPIMPILLRAKESGRATGLVTTTRVTHATPAGFSTNTGSRGSSGDIAGQLLDRRYDLVMGGGARHFKSLDLSTHRVVRTREELGALTGIDEANVLGLFADSHMSYEIERPAHEPTLQEMTRFALKRLSADGRGFVLQIEGGRVDHAAHDNDAGSLVREQYAFDRAVGVAAEFAMARNDTLLVVTTDHATANPALTEYTTTGTEGFERLLGITHSFDWIASRIGAAADREAGRIAEIVHQATAIEITQVESQTLARWIAGEGVDPFAPAGRGYGPLGSILANHTGVAFLSPNHTCDFVELTALGPGVERIAPFMAINEVHEVIRGALDLAPARPM